MSYTDKLKGQKSTLDSGNYVSLSDLEVLFEESVGKLRFLGLNSERFERDDETGEMTSNLLERRYRVFSEEQSTDFIVRVAGTVDLIDIEMGAYVKIVNPVVDEYAISRDNDGFTILADNIVADKSGVSTPQPQATQQPKQEEVKK